MAHPTIGVYSVRGELAGILRQHCAAWTFASDGTERAVCRVIVVDTDSGDVLDSPPRKSLVRIILGHADSERLRRQGELWVERDAFLTAPAEYLAFATDLAETAMHASQLELEVGYLTEIRELMSMVEAEAVSERITRSILNILGLPSGTLFLHDPRLERYVVSFSNDAAYHETGEFLPGVPPDLLHHPLSSRQFFPAARPARLI